MNELFEPPHAPDTATPARSSVTVAVTVTLALAALTSTDAGLATNACRTGGVVSAAEAAPPANIKSAASETMTADTTLEVVLTPPLVAPHSATRNGGSRRPTG